MFVVKLMCSCNQFSDRVFITIMPKVGVTEYNMIYKGLFEKSRIRR